MIKSESSMRGYGFAWTAVLCFSPGALLVRQAYPIPPMTIAAFRLLLAAGCMAGVARVRGTYLCRGLRKTWRLTLIGLIAAIHFATFTMAINHTSIAHALALCYTAPMFAGLGERLLFGQRLTLRQICGMLLVCVSISVAKWHPLQEAHVSTMGNLFALVSGISLGMYHLAGRRMGTSLSLEKYTFWIYLSAGLYLIPFVEISESIPQSAWFAVLLQGMIATAIGHTMANGALRYVPASHVTLITTQEVTGGIILSWLFLGEEISWHTALLVLPLLIGLFLALRRDGHDQENDYSVSPVHHQPSRATMSI